MVTCLQSHLQMSTPDMQKVETLLPADFQFKFSALPENKGPLAEYTNFRQFSANITRLLGRFYMAACAQAVQAYHCA